MFSNKIRAYLRHIVLSCLGRFAKPSNSIHILNGHMISRDRGSGTIEDRNRFDNLLNELSKECDFINFEEAVNLIVSKTNVDRPQIAFSFDDGFEDCYHHIVPILEKYGVNAMFFINPNFATAGDANDEDYISNFTDVTTLSPGKRPMNWNQIKELSERGFLFGAHTLDHSRLSISDPKEMKRQISDCRKIIENKIGRVCDCFAWPYGKLTDANLEAVNEACSTYEYVFSQGDYIHYFSYDGKVINRRHFEAWWPLSHVRYFLSKTKI